MKKFLFAFLIFFLSLTQVQDVKAAVYWYINCDCKPWDGTATMDSWDTSYELQHKYKKKTSNPSTSDYKKVAWNDLKEHNYKCPTCGTIDQVVYMYTDGSKFSSETVTAIKKANALGCEYVRFDGIKSITTAPETKLPKDTGITWMFPNLTTLSVDIFINGEHGLYAPSLTSISGTPFSGSTVAHVCKIPALTTYLKDASTSNKNPWGLVPRSTRNATCTETGLFESPGGYVEYTRAKIAHVSVNGGEPDAHLKCSRCGTPTSTAHSFTVDSGEIYREATCTTARQNFKKCSCGYNPYSTSYVVSTGSALGHANVKGGTKAIHLKCSRCGATTSTAHSYTSSVAVKPTCTVKGTTKYTCACGYSYTAQDIAIDAKNHTGQIIYGGTQGVHQKYDCCGATVSTTHSYTVDSGVQFSEATCTDKRKNYLKCTCGYNPLAVNHLIEVGEPLGHSYGDPTYTWSDYASCTAKRICSRDSGHIETQAATITNTVTKAATCTATGVKTYTAKFTNAAFTPQTKTETLAKNPSNHTGKSVNGGTFAVHTKYDCCGATISSTHNYTVDSGVQFTAATCTKARVNYKKCSCGYNPKSTDHVISVGEPLGHSYNSPTYTWNGYTSCKALRVCSRDANHTETETGNSTNKITKATSCSEEGIRTYTVKFTNTAFATQTKDEAIAKLAHTPIKGGIAEVHEKCSVCNATLSSKHTFTSKVTTAPTCTEKGTTTYTCACGYIYTSQDVDIDKDNHTGKIVFGGTAGVHTKYDCCNAIVSEEHNYTVDSGVQAKVATCTTPRFNYLKCECGYNPKQLDYIVATGEPLGHDYAGPTFVWDAFDKCTAKRVCNRDAHHIETEEGTITSEITKAPTCVDTGIRTYTAVFVNRAFATQKTTDVEPANGHTESEYVYEDNDDVRKIVCTVCDEVLETAYRIQHNCPTGVTCDFEPGYFTSDDVVRVVCDVEEGYSWVGTSGPVEADKPIFNIENVTETSILTVIVKPNDYEVKGLAGAGVESVSGNGIYPYKSSYELEANPKPGYTFTGWSGGVESTENPLKGSVPLNGLTVMASAKANTDTPYTVQHWVMNTDGTYPTIPTKVDTYKGTTDTEITNLAGYRKDSLQIANGIIFDCVKVDGAQVTSTNLNGDGSTVIDVFYERVKYTVNYNKGKGVDTLLDSKQYYYGQTATIPTATYLKGYEFGSWSGDYTSASNNLTFTMPAKDVQLTLVGKPIDYAINYKLNGGGFTTSYCRSYNIEDINTILINPTRMGYDFTGWTGSNGSDPETQVTIAKGNTGEKTYSAHWSPIQYTILYDLGGGQFAAIQPAQYNIETTTFTVDEPTRENYDFVGWEIDEGTEIVTEDEVTVEKQALKLFAPNIEAVAADKGTWERPDTPKEEYEPLTPIVTEQGLAFNKGTTGNYVLTALWSLQDIEVEGVADSSYTGNPITFDNIVLRTESGTIPKSSYNVSYENNVDIGTAAVKFELTNGYDGEVTKLFNINMANDFKFDDNGLKYQIIEVGGEQVIAVIGGTDPNATEIDIPNTVTIGGVEYVVRIIKEGAFSGYTYLEKVVIGDNVTNIEEDVFKNCTNLTEIKSPVTVPDNAVKGCDKLDTVKKDAVQDVVVKAFTVKKLRYNVTKAGQVELVGTTNKKLTTLKVPKTVKYNGVTYKVTSIGNKAFRKAAKLKKVTIGDNVTSIGKSAFESCKKLTTVTVGKKVQKINSKAFYKCSKLKKLTIKSTKLKTVGSKAISGIYKKATIKVPKKQYKSYKKKFKSKTGFKKTMKLKK